MLVYTQVTRLVCGLTGTCHAPEQKQQDHSSPVLSLAQYSAWWKNNPLQNPHSTDLGLPEINSYLYPDRERHVQVLSHSVRCAYQNVGICIHRTLLTNLDRLILIQQTRQNYHLCQVKLNGLSLWTSPSNSYYYYSSLLYSAILCSLANSLHSCQTWFWMSAVLEQVLCTPFSHAPVYSVTSFKAT